MTIKVVLASLLAVSLAGCAADGYNGYNGYDGYGGGGYVGDPYYYDQPNYAVPYYGAGAVYYGGGGYRYRHGYYPRPRPGNWQGRRPPYVQPSGRPGLSSNYVQPSGRPGLSNGGQPIGRTRFQNNTPGGFQPNAAQRPIRRFD
jgi:hypothetical protein